MYFLISGSGLATYRYFSVSCKVSSVVMNPKCHLSVRLFSSPSTLTNLPGRVFQAVGPFLSALCISPATVFWPAKYWLRNHLLTLWGRGCGGSLVCYLFSSCCLQVYLFNFCHFNYSVFVWVFLGYLLPGPKCVSFPKLKKLSAIISSNTLCPLLSLLLGSL